MEPIARSEKAYPQSTLTPRWWETVSGMFRPYLRSDHSTLAELTAQLDTLKAGGIDAVEIFAPCKGGICYQGLDTLDYYEIDPAIGAMEDLISLIAEAHRRGMAMILFMNFGYGHEQFPAFLKACEDIRLGVHRPETRMFLWSDNGQDTMDHNQAPYFLNDADGGWRWSEAAQKYFWVKWEGEQGGHLLPQLNFGDPGWQEEVRRIIEFWLGFGIDGMVIDAVNWYINCDWNVARSCLTGPILEADNQFCQPEGAGGFDDNPVEWIRQGEFNCVMDYAIKKWWTGHDVIRQAIIKHDPQPIEAALRGYRDRVAQAGGICYIDLPDLRDLPEAAQILGAAAVATMGELLIFIGDQLQGWSPDVRKAINRLMELRRKFPALGAGGRREQIQTQDDSKYYAFLRWMGSDETTLLVVLNFQPEPGTVQIKFNDRNIARGIDVWAGEEVVFSSNLVEVALPAYGFAIYRVLLNSTEDSTTKRSLHREEHKIS
ncbi:MAG: alpha-amylase family glycosyl hydrolase [Chloroflexota bacterium]